MEEEKGRPGFDTCCCHIHAVSANGRCPDCPIHSKKEDS